MSSRFKAGCSLLNVFIAVILPALAQAAPRQTLSGHVPRAAATSPVLAPLAAATPLRLAIGLPLRNQSSLTELLGNLYDPASPGYRQFITPEQFTERFGPSVADYQAVITFLKANGFTNIETHPNRMIVDAIESVAGIERAFHLKMGLRRHPLEARNYYSPDSEPSLDLAVPLLHISGLDNYVVPRPASLLVEPGNGSSSGTPQTGSGPSGSFLGNDFRTAYAPGVSLTGSNQMVGLLQFDGYRQSAITAYETLAGLPNVPLINVLLDGISGAAGSDNVEVALDIEMSISMAPGLAAVIVYEGQLGDDILNRMATDNLAKQLSSSWSFGIDPATDQIYQQFAAQGQSYFNACGDSDAYAGAMPAPVDHPFVTSVGGTILSMTDSGAAWLSETVWNRNNGIGTGGGISTTWPIPSWQQGVSMVANQGSTTMRNIPDVAMVAESVWVIYNTSTQGFVAGTSVASPLWAGFMALVNQQAAARGKPPIGFLNPVIYPIGLGAGYASAFHDIQTGNNTNSSSPDLFFAVPGYDLCTGWGTPAGSGLINLLAPPFNAPLVTNAIAVLAAENCFPTNGVIDAGETVTVNFGLRNIGGLDTTNLVATLLPGGGVGSPGNPQTYGVLAAEGPVVTLPFTFTATGACGSVLTATLQLQDGAANLGNLAFTFQTGVPMISFTQNFDGVSAPALPAGWTRSISGAAANWVTSTANRDTLPNAAFASESANPGVAELVSPSIPIATASAQLLFRNNYNAETDPAVTTKAYDGGVLEIKIGGGAFTDILAAGGSFVAGGYNKTIDPTDDNPLDGRQCWSGLSGGFITTIVNLPAGAAGQNIQLKWRFATDTGNAFGTGGWYIDGVQITDGYTCCTRVLVPPVINLAGSDVTPTNVSISLLSVAGLNYTLQFKNSLTDATWTPIPPVIPGTGSVIILQDTNGASSPTRFYRVICN